MYDGAVAGAFGHLRINNAKSVWEDDRTVSVRLAHKESGGPSPLTRVPKTGWQAQAMRGKRWGHDTHKERRRFQIPIEVSILFANVSLAAAHWFEKQASSRNVHGRDRVTCIALRGIVR